jgi:hypothetical protein
LRWPTLSGGVAAVTSELVDVTDNKPNQVATTPQRECCTKSSLVQEKLCRLARICRLPVFSGQDARKLHFQHLPAKGIGSQKSVFISINAVRHDSSQATDKRLTVVSDLGAPPALLPLTSRGLAAGSKQVVGFPRTRDTELMVNQTIWQ